jgi:hypothetical protein
VLYDVNNPIPNSVFANQSFQTFVNINDELGNLLYREEHYASTDGNGLITVKMGDGLYVAGPISNFNQIDWGTGKYYLVVDFNINNTISSTAPEQLVTVPYSFYSGKAGNGMTSVADNGNGTLTFTYANGATYTTPTLSGIQGTAGAAGPVGPTGATGPTGQSAYELWLAQGNTGSVQDFLSTSAYQIWLAQGNTGTAQDFLNTLVGPAGASGPTGQQGIAGVQGMIGPSGPQGIQGPAGVAGATGPQGIQGPVGPTGMDGKSAYEIAVLNGFVGTETQWLLSLVGATGVAGPTGATGPQGPVGLTGATGPQGLQGATGATGSNGLNALIKTTTEPSGANCTNGGTKIETGLDANGNGILDGVEVNLSQTQYVCNGIGLGSLSGESFDWKVPDGLSNTATNVNVILAPQTPAYNCCSSPPAGWYNNVYTVPLGYNLYITNMSHGLGYGSTSLGIRVNNVQITNSSSNGCNFNGQKNVIVGEGMQVSFTQNGFSSNPCYVTIQANFTGFLLPKSVTAICQTTPYLVPSGYKFIKYDPTLSVPFFYMAGQSVPAGVNGYIIPN